MVVTTMSLLQAHGGFGVTSPIRQFPSSVFGGGQLTGTLAHPAGGASIAFQGVSHFVLGSVDRIVSDSCGLGAATTSSATVSWRFRRLNSRWWSESSLGWQRLQSTTLLSTSGLRVTTALGRNLGQRVSLVVQYAYLQYSGQQIPSYGNGSNGQNGVRVSLRWSPGAAVSK